MDALSAVGGAGGAQASESSQGLIMLKKSHDMAKQQSAQLLEALPPPPRSPSPQGVGGHVDLSA
jgi:hypothetical protein